MVFQLFIKYCVAFACIYVVPVITWIPFQVSVGLNTTFEINADQILLVYHPCLKWYRFLGEGTSSFQLIIVFLRGFI